MSDIKLNIADIYGWQFIKPFQKIILIIASVL